MSLNHVETDVIDAQLKEIDKMYTEATYWQRLKKMQEGLKSPRDSKEYKEAMIEMQRLSAPVVALLLPVFLVGLLVVFSAAAKTNDRVIETQILEVEEIKQLEEIKELEKPPEQTTDVTVDVQVDSPNVSDARPTENTPMSPQPQTFDAVQIVKSPVILKNIYGSTRNTGTRGSLLGRFGGDKQTEEAVMRTLRWLKKNQKSNGSWGGQSIAMTGLSILTFLAHGEKPGESEEFGPTVQKALEFLISQADGKGRFKGCDGHEYALAIATYAICEAYGMTMNPNVKEVAEKSLATIIAGQHASGGWNYNLNKEDRDDTSYMGWCAQALKAGKMANLQVEGLEKATKLAIRGFKKNAGASGGFGYTGPSGNSGLTSVGTLCMQLLGASAEKEVKMSLDVMDTWSPSFDEKQAALGGESLQYYFYYATQCKFHAGGRRWDAWNTMMKKIYVPAQKVTPKASSGYVDHKGNPQDIGWWENKDKHTDRPVMDTCLAALQLMVYYRYLPTTSAAAIKVEEEIKVSTSDKEDIKVDAGNL